MIKIRGYRILVKPQEIETVSKGGIVIIANDNEERLAEAGQQFGEVVGIGHTCWQGENMGEPWAAVGDTILFSKYAGKFCYDPETEEKYVVMNDTDVIAIIENGANK